MLEDQLSSLRDGNLNKLVELQKKIAEEVVLEDAFNYEEIKYVVGVDQAFFKKGDKEFVVSAAVLMSFPDLRFIDSGVDLRKVDFPYIPTFLMFREGDSAVEAVKKVLREKTVIIVDGSGIAHPRKCGLATFVGVALRNPSIGVTKRPLYGKFEEPKRSGESKGIFNDELIGYAYKPCARCNPIYVSPGNMISPETALRVVVATIRNYKLPIPIREAHKMANREKLNYLSDLDSSG